MEIHRNKQLWFVTGSQHLYGQEALEKVAVNSKKIVSGLAEADQIPIDIIFKSVATTPEEINQVCLDANYSPECIGLITWMHTFSPAKMWIAGLSILNKPLAHLHTQFNRDIPWDSIDMDYMNLNQSAHGDREFGFIGARIGLPRKIIVGYWQEQRVLDELGNWSRAALAWDDSHHLKIARFGDNMREVAVTEGNKVSAQMTFGYAVNGYGLGDLTAYVNQATDSQVDQLINEYCDLYFVQKELQPGGSRSSDLREAAKIEIGLRAFLEEGDFKAFTTTFENLYGLAQLPGLSAQRLMADGYGFGAEGDWKTAALVRSMKVMAAGLEGGTSFMEDYTYHFEPGNQMVLGAHMLEVCASIADGKPSLEVHPLGIGGKDDPPRLVFNVQARPALNATIIDLGGRFRMLINEVDVVTPSEELPHLPVGRVIWKPLPDLPTAASTWILAGGAHHTCFSQAVHTSHLLDFAEMAGIEVMIIDKNTDMNTFKDHLRWNEMYYHLIA
ncbi:MAG: L-arabinose isomerase [Anaerolineales bacterium]|nr:L-arabinose isomerase [Anaerolineales bacterium]